MYDETLANTSKQSTQQRGKRKEQRKRTQVQAQRTKSKVEHKRAKEQIIFQRPPLVAQSIFERERDGKLERTLSLEEASLTTTMCLKIKTT
jgi:hypothetical protein